MTSKSTTINLFTVFILFFSSVLQAEVARSSFTTNIQDREPIDQLYALTDGLKEVFYFTELKNLQGQTITHQWSTAGKASHSITFDVGANRWRVYSSKTLNKPEGTWTVTVSDANGLILKEESISYGNAGAIESDTTTSPEKATSTNKSIKENTSETAVTTKPETQTKDATNTDPDKPEQDTAEQMKTNNSTAKPESETAKSDMNKTGTDDKTESDNKAETDKPVWDNL
jgi:hypothetical protein